MQPDTKRALRKHRGALIILACYIVSQLGFFFLPIRVAFIIGWALGAVALVGLFLGFRDLRNQ